MHFYETTFTDKERDRVINTVLGKAFGFLDRWRMKGIGSRRLMIDKVSPDFEVVMNRKTNVNYSTIEIRPNGIIVHFVNALKSYAWVIPYEQLIIKKNEQYRISSNGKFVEIKNDNQQKPISQFIAKVNGLQQQFLQEN